MDWWVLTAVIAACYLVVGVVNVFYYGRLYDNDATLRETITMSGLSRGNLMLAALLVYPWKDVAKMVHTIIDWPSTAALFAMVVTARIVRRGRKA